MQVSLYDGSYHEVDSSEIAFKIAANMGFKEAVRKAAPIVLEPIMKLEVTTPEEFLGAVGSHYLEFAQVEDAEVKKLLSES